MAAPNMLARRKQLYGDTWFLPLGDSKNPVRIGWPARSVAIGNAKYIQMCENTTVAQTPFLHCFDEEMWEAAEISWEAPLARVARHWKKADAKQGHMAMVPGKPQKLMKYVARNAFHDLPKTTLASLCNHLGVATGSTSGLLNLLVALITNQLGQQTKHALVVTCRVVSLHSHLRFCAVISRVRPCVIDVHMIAPMFLTTSLHQWVAGSK